MSIRTTITLDEDVLERVRGESRSRGASFKDTLNDLLRVALVSLQNPAQPRSFEITPAHMGYKAGLNFDDVESLLEFGEGERHR